MSIEMWSIAALSLMLMAITFWQGGLVPLTHGLKWGLGSRDSEVAPSNLQGRLGRIRDNHVEAMLIIVPIMALIIVLDRTNAMTQLAAWLIIGGRIAFIPIYAAGIAVLRSLAYAVAMVGVVILLIQLF